MPGGHKFCGQCGTPLQQAPATPGPDPCQDTGLLDLRALMPRALADKIRAVGDELAGERREIAVLFADIANFTCACQSLDSEDAYLVVDEVMSLLVSVVYKYEGTIDKFTGDGVMALFGAPVTHENDPERAVRAALEMQAAIRPLQGRVQQQHGFGLQMRIGVNTGLAIAGRIGSDLHMEYTVIGETVNLAQRLETAAEPGTVLVSFSTYQPTRPLFDYATPAPVAIKGMAEPVQAYRPLRLSLNPGRVRGLPGLQVPMVGRSGDLARLQEALARVRRHRRTMVALITGEAGLGKSRLLSEFRVSLAHADVSFHQGNCLAYARSRPLWVVADLLRNILGVSEADPPDLQRDTLHAFLSILDLANDQVLPYLANLLGIADTDPAILKRLSLLDASMLQHQTHTALRQVFLAQARLSPTVLILDDLHWIDQASRDFLRHLIETTGDVPLMLVLVSRDTERETAIRPLVAACEEDAQRLVDIQLRPLSAAEAQLLVEHLLARSTDEAREFQTHIAERAEGNPFYTEEIVRMLIDHGGLFREAGRWRVTSLADELLDRVPGSLKGLILTRFDRLPDRLRLTLQKAAVVGPTFAARLLTMIDDAPVAAIASQLRELEARQFITAQPAGQEQTYTFRHALIQDAVYGTLMRQHRQKLHTRVAEAVERSSLFTPEEQAEMLVRHYLESTTSQKALPYLIAAAEHAARRCAYEIAAKHYRRAIVLATNQPAGMDDAYAHIHLSLGRALKYLGDFTEADRVLWEVLQSLLRSAEPDDGAVLATLVEGLTELADVRQREGAMEEALSHLEASLDALGERGQEEHPKLWHKVIDRMAWVHFRQGKLDEALDLAQVATADPQWGEDETIRLASLYNILGGILWQRGSLSEATTYVERSVALYQGLGYTRGLAKSYTNLGVLHYAQGDWSHALEALAQAHALWEQIGDIQYQALNLNNLGVLRQSMGEHELAQQNLESALDIRQRLGDAWGTAQSLSSLAHLAFVQSRLPDAASYAEAALEQVGAGGSPEIQVQARWVLALVEAERDLAPALRVAERAYAEAKDAGPLEQEADCCRVLGALHGRAGDSSKAVALLHESIDVSRRRSDPYRHGLALLELGRVYQRLVYPGNPAREQWQAKSIEALSQAVETFERLGATSDLKQARAALAAVRAGVAAGVTLPQAGAPDTAAAQPGWQPGGRAGERRSAAIVWLILSAPPGADDEAVFATISHVLPPLTALVRERQGEVLRRRSGLTAVFGAPAAHEDDAERAVDTAWRMMRYLSEPSNFDGVPLMFRLAVTLGEVVAGDVGHQAQLSLLVTGEPVQLAEQMAELAPPGAVLVSPQVCAATSHRFVFAAPSPGVTSPPDGPSMSALVGERGRPGVKRGPPGEKAKFVGREPQLGAMRERAQNLDRGSGGLIWIEGEAGIGKTRLMQEFAASMEARGVRVWAGGCSLQTSGRALSLFTNLLSQVFEIRTTDTQEQICARIDQAMQGWPVDARTTRPYLELLCGVRPAERDAQRLATLEPDQLRQQTFVAVHRLLNTLATEAPLIILLDDLHWIDPMSCQLLLFISGLVSSAPLLFVCAQRPRRARMPDDRLDRLKELHPRRTERLFLDRLSGAESDSLLREYLGGAELSGRLHAAILDRCSGNPYYIEEFVRMLIEQGYLQPVEDHWAIDEHLDPYDLPLPSSLEALVRARVDALTPELKHVLQCASVIGRPFETGLLGAISGIGHIEAALTQLESRGLLHIAPGVAQWQFGHPLCEAVVYNGLLKARRRALHLRIADAIEACWEATLEDRAEDLGYHLTRAGEGARALPYLVLSGERAAGRSANEEAISYFKQAARLVSAHAECDDSLRWRTAVGLGDTYRAVGKYAESTATLQAALPLVTTGELSTSRLAGLHRRLGETAQKHGRLDVAKQHFDAALHMLDKPSEPGPQAEAARILVGLAWTHFHAGRSDAALNAGQLGLRYAQSSGTVGELAMAENILGGIHHRRGEWTLALRHTMRAKFYHEQMGYTWGVASSLSNLGILAIATGDWSKSRSYFEHSLALRQELGDVEGVAIVHNNLGSVARDQGELELAESHFQESLAVATPLKMQYHAANSMLGLSQVLLLQGEAEAAQEAISTSLRQAEKTSARDLVAEAHRTQAEILLARGDLSEAAAMAKQAAEEATETGNRVLEAAAWRVASDCALRQAHVGVASDFLDRARQALVDVTDELETGRIAVQAGQLSAYQGDILQAQAHLADAQSGFARLGASFDLQKVEENLSQTLIPVDRLITPTSRREVNVYAEST